MEALIVFVVMHCGAVEALIKDDMQSVGWTTIGKDQQEGAHEFVMQEKAKGAKVVVLQVKDDKCATST